jgi:periplasmic divalent cation tolerance protein
MIIIYITLNNPDEARKIGRELLEKNLANCVNFFPITCIYNYENQITEEPEVVMIIKTQDGYFEKVETVIKSHIDYDNFIGQIKVEKVNNEFSSWLDKTVS